MQFVIKKMKTENLSHVNYNLCDISMNELIGHDIEIFWTGKIKCFCDKLCKSFYRQNFCYNCYWTLPQASQSVFKPELCTAHLEIEERDLEWEKKISIGAPLCVFGKFNRYKSRNNKKITNLY